MMFLKMYTSINFVLFILLICSFNETHQEVYDFTVEPYELGLFNNEHTIKNTILPVNRFHYVCYNKIYKLYKPTVFSLTGYDDTHTKSNKINLNNNNIDLKKIQKICECYMKSFRSYTNVKKRVKMQFSLMRCDRSIYHIFELFQSYVMLNKDPSKQLKMLGFIVDLHNNRL